MKKAIRVFGMALMIMAGGSVTGLAANRTSTTSGDWTNNATWGGNPYPTNGDSAYINHDLTITNSEQVSLGSGQWYIGNSALIGSLKVSKSGSVLSSAVGTLGNTHGNSMTVSSTGLVSVAGLFWFGNSRSRNSLTIDSGGVVSNANTFYLGYGDARSNSVLVTGSGSRLDNSASGVYIGRGFSVITNSGFNSLTIADGGAVNSKGAHVGYQVSANLLANFNTALVTGPASKWTLNDPLYVSRGGAGTNNILTITNGGQVVVTSGAINVADTAGATGNGILLASGGLLEANSLGIVLGNAANSGNYVTNSGGILQFTTATPTITITAGGGGNAIVMDSGTLSYRNVASVNLTNNWNSANPNVYKFTWQGANTFRLDNSTGKCDVAYVFDTNQVQLTRNYSGLEMVNGGTAVTNGSVTIGTNGWLLCSNTTAILWGAVTNHGTMRIYNSSVTFKTNLYLGAGCTNTALSTNQLPMTVQGVLTLNGGTVKLPAGLGATDSFTLFTSPNTILGSVSSLTVTPNSHRAVLSDDSKSIVVRPRQPGFVFIVD